MRMSMIGFAFPVLVSGYLYVSSLVQAASSNMPAAVVLAVLVLGLLSGYVLEWPSVFKGNANIRIGAPEIKIFVAVICGAVASYWLNTRIGLGPVLGEGLVLILAALTFPALGAPIASGAFLGMVTAKVFPGFEHLLLAAAIAGVINVLAKDVMGGFGGKLGAMGASGCVIAALFTGNKFTAGAVPDLSITPYIIVTGIVAGVASYMINNNLKHGPVMSAGVISVLGALVLPVLFPKVGASMATVCAYAAIAGMSSRARIPSEGFMAVVGALAGVGYMFGSPFLGGAGGKAGTTALGSVIAVWGWLGLSKRFSGKQSQAA